MAELRHPLRCESQRSAARSTHRRRGEQGFTLVEVLVALGILIFAAGTIAGGFARGVEVQQNGELVRDASRVCEIVQERLAEENLLGKEFEALPDDILDQTLPGYPGLRYDVVFEGQPRLGFPVYCRLTVRWLRRGEDVGEIFRFPLPRGRPLPQRVRDSMESQR